MKLDLDIQQNMIKLSVDLGAPLRKFDFDIS